MELLTYWRILHAYRVMLIVLCGSALITSVLLTYVVPEKYEAKVLVLIKPQERIRFLPNKSAKEVLDFPVNQGVPYDVPSKTYIEVIRSRALVEKIVYDLDLQEKQKRRLANESKGRLERLKERLKEYAEGLVSVLKYGRVEDVDPLEEAVNDVQRGLSLYATKNTVVFEIAYLNDDPQEAADVANAAAQVFIEYISEVDQGQAANSRLSIENQLRERKEELDDARLALRAFKEKEGTIALDDEYAATLKIIRDLRTDLERTQVELAGLLETYTDSHPKVMSLLAERDRLRESLSELESKVEAIPKKEKELRTLELRVRVAEDNFELVGQEHEEARIQQAQSLSEIKIVSPAIPPSNPCRPIKIHYAGTALLLALLAGVGIMVIRESTSPRIRSIEDVARALELRVLATVPLIKGSKKT